MTAHAYSEDQLVEQPAIGLFAALGWQTVSALEETFGAGGTLGRETRGEVVLVNRLRAVLVRLNPTLPPEAIQTAIDELTRDRSAMSLEAANREVYRLLKEGITVSVPDRDALSPGPRSAPHGRRCIAGRLRRHEACFVQPRLHPACGRGGQTTERLRVQLKLTIEDTLDSGLPRAYTPELYNQKCSAVFEHVYESYPERDAGVYA